MTTFKKEDCFCKYYCSEYGQDSCSSLCQSYWYSSYVLSRSNIPLKLQTPKQLQPPGRDVVPYQTLNAIKKDIYRFVYEGQNLFIYSEYKGNGKTTWATNLMLQYFYDVSSWCGKTIRGVFVSVPMFLLQLKNSMSTPDPNFEQFKESLRIADLVIWDDLGSSKLSAYDVGVLYAYIQERLLSGKSNIYTGTFEKTALTHLLTANLEDTICNNSLLVKFNSEVYRGNDFFTNNQ